MKIIDGKKLRDVILEKVKKAVVLLPFQPVFCDVLVGDDPASVQYVQMKAHTAESVGLKFHRANFPASIQTPELIAELKKLNEVKNMCGIIVQLPLPEHLDRGQVLNAIAPELDVDCLGEVASAKFYGGDTGLGFPTALACMAILDSLNLDNDPSTALRTRKIVVLGQGMLVGKPVAALLQFRGLHPKIVTRGTENKEKIIKEADIIISGIGKGQYITGAMIKAEAVIIDAGTSESLGHSPLAIAGRARPTGEPTGAIVGDVDFESVQDVAGYLSPVPGGVGPVTVAMLLHNVLTVAKSFDRAQDDSTESKI